MTTRSLPPSSRRPGRYLALAVTGASALLAGFVFGYALGTVHACDRHARGGRHGI